MFQQAIHEYLHHATGIHGPNKVGEVSDERRCSRGEIVQLMHSALLQTLTVFWMEKLSCPFSHLGKPMSLHLSTQKTAVVWAGFGWLSGSKMDCRPALGAYQNPLDFPILLTNSLTYGPPKQEGIIGFKTMLTKLLTPMQSISCNHIFQCWHMFRIHVNHKPSQTQHQEFLFEITFISFQWVRLQIGKM